MPILSPPIYDFDRLTPITMTIIIPYEVEELNLPAIFALLPVTNQTLPSDCIYQKKQGKIRLPAQLNSPGVILSMRYDHQVRGIVRSESAKSFSHTIIMDIGTSDRIISAKLSRSSIELTGPTSYSIAYEAANFVLQHVKTCQSKLNLIQSNLELAIQIKEQVIEELKGTEEEEEPRDEVATEIYEYFKENSRGYSSEMLPDFLDFLVNFSKPLYQGSLELGKLECQMVNLLFNIGFPVNQVAFAQIMNKEPFEASYTNLKRTPNVIVVHKYYKLDNSEKQHTIRVNKSGHVKYSGPNLETMRVLYYAFMQRVIIHARMIRSVEQSKHKIRPSGQVREYTIEEFKQLLKEEEELRQYVVNNIWEAPPDFTLENLISSDAATDTSENKNEILDSYIEQSEAEGKTNCGGQSPQYMQFDYKPILVV